MDKIYKVGSKNLRIVCKNEKFCDFITSHMIMFHEVYDTFYDTYIIIEDNQIRFKVSKEYTIKKDLINTDLYPLLFNVLSNLINEKDTILMHSVAIKKDENAILIVGDFNSGKTHFSTLSTEVGFSEVSTDWSVLQIKNNKLYLLKGSQYKKLNKNIAYIKEQVEPIEIKFILHIDGLCDKGKVDIAMSDNKIHCIKSLFKFCTWSADIPLFTDGSILDLNRHYIMQFLDKIELNMYNIRGDAREIIKIIGEKV